ncbi:NAD-dependent epimerase/dehydratase family protein [Clostridium tertium]|uniref:GDP-6-deoxy-D-mannose reductase n=1 Tax=Clostridium tertium TaxID=1559 RepID=A0A6N2ZGD3_9CLOT
MKKVLIIGINGFVGTHLSNEFKNNGYRCYGADLNPINICENIDMFSLDILDKKNVLDVFKVIRPDYIVNLAAISSVKLSWEIPQKTFDVNVNGTINILETIKELDLKTKLLLIGSSEQYGDIDYTKAVSEEDELNALNPYGISKATQEKVAKLYSRVYGIDVMMVRAFNHIGPGQGKGFVVPDFVSQIVEIEKGILEPIIKVGNLSAERDFTDVRDIVSAYRLILENGNNGEVYNVGSGKAISIREILDIIVDKSRTKVKIEIDKNKFRPIDTPKIECNNRKLKSETGWNIKYSIDESIEDIIEYWRKYSVNGGRNE